MATPTSATAARQLALKMKLEPRLRREMSVLFANISKEMRSTYSTTGATLDASQFKDEVQSILRQHYRRVSKVFSIGLRQQIKKAITIDEVKQIDDEVDAALAAFIGQTTSLRATEIIRTTQAAIDGSIAFGLTFEFDEAVVTANNAQIAAVAQKEFNRKTKSRPQTIAVTETQTAAEGSKQIEAETIAIAAASDANTLPSNLMKKEWITVLDNRTRTAHVFADGQRVDINEPFIVDGERLNFPADTSLGATAGNVINCRCIASYIVEDEALVSAVDTRIRPQTGPATENIGGVVGL
jgi:uncharacterized protein with gpF-like domain